MELIPLLFISLDTIIQYGPYVGAGITFILGAYKDTILSKLNLKKTKSEVDSIHIQNSKELMELYSKSVADLNAWNEQNLQKIEKRHQDDIEDLKEKHQEDIEEIKQLHTKNITEIKEAKAVKETALNKTVEKLKEEVEKLTLLVAQLSKQIAFYKEHSDLELPEDLR